MYNSSKLCKQVPKVSEFRTWNSVLNDHFSMSELIFPQNAVVLLYLFIAILLEKDNFPLLMVNLNMFSIMKA